MAVGRRKGFAEHVAAALAASASERPEDDFDLLVAKGLITSEGEVTKRLGGTAEAVPAEAFTVEPDGEVLTTVLFATVRDRPVVAIQGRPFPRTQADIGKDLSDLLSHSGLEPVQSIKVFRSHTGGDPVGQINANASTAHGWKWSAGAKAQIAKTLTEAFEDLFAELRRTFVAGL